ncbi:MAG TPA: hypothetical protein VM285_17445 [Polyangia bacterium]|nr:hypothetical protein [Polyangia bacterium]
MTTNPNVTPLELPDRRAISAELVAPIVAKARELVVTSAEDSERAGEFLVWVASNRKLVIEKTDPSVKAAHAAHKAALALQKEMTAPLDSARRVVQNNLIQWQTEQERIARAEQLRLQAEAQAKHEAEQLAARERARREEEDRRLAEAAALELAGEDEAAAAVIDAPEPEPAPLLPAPPPPIVYVEAQTPKLAGVSTSKRWKARVVDLSAFLTWVAAKEERFRLVEPVGKYLDALARMQEDAFNVPGCEAYQETGLSVRG